MNGNMAKPEKVFHTIHHLWLFFHLHLLLLLPWKLSTIPHSNFVVLTFNFLNWTPSLLVHHVSSPWLIQSSNWTLEAPTLTPLLFHTGISLKKMKKTTTKKSTALMKQWLYLMVESTTNVMTILNPFGTMLKSHQEH